MRTKLGIPEDALAHVFVGGGFERKGLFRLIEAFARSGRQDAHLLVVGRDKGQARAQRLAASRGVAARVHFAGAQLDVQPWYAAADSFVLPTLYDPFPNAALEAMACGLPVIVTFQSGTAELISEGVNGMVCDALDEASLADLLARLDPARAREMGAHARETAAQFGLEAMAQKLVALYRDLTRDRPAPS
jgi:UDP-glucose:(heptosyl)LPS alpha-1,3-glucosyltransferase